MGDLSKHFSKDEFKCRCCGLFIENKELIKKLEKLRKAIGMPIKINSGCRCMHHNTMVHGNGNSSHLTGKAADITCNNMFVMRRNAYQIFDRIGIAENYIHCDVDDTKVQCVDWVY